MPFRPRTRSIALFALSLLGGCSGGSSPPAVPPSPPPNSTDPMWCGRGTDVMGASAADGFCLKSYAQIGEARALVAAPNGDLFVAAPSAPTPGGASDGPGAIFLLSDDDHDGVAEPHVFLSHIADVHGLALGDGYLYFTTKTSVWRMAYQDGQRVGSGAPESLNLPPIYATGGRWTHGLARSAKGQLFTSRGSYAVCNSSAGGDINAIGADGSLTVLASGFRNPMYLRCHQTDEVCAAMELGEDQTTGAREKMLIIRPDTNYGYPCCLTKSAAIPAQPMAMCDDVAKEDAAFQLSNTPFGFDWERGMWPAPFTGAVFVALHGSAYSRDIPWEGAAIVYAPVDPQTHVPVQDWQPFQTGFGFGGAALDRPSDVTFASDGRMFFSDDASGNVFWVAPKTLAAPAAPTAR
jgi:glucose/arabinose dehydrogenase